LIRKTTNQEVKGNHIKKKHGRGKREILLLSVLAILLILLAYLFNASASRAEGAAPQAQQTQQPPSSPASPPVPPKPPTAEQKIEELQGKVASDSLNFHLHYELANALHDAGQREEAVLEYDKALSIEPNFVEALVNKGAVYNELGRIPDAIASFQKVLALNPKDTRALCNMGNSFYALKDYGNAMGQYKLAVEADSTFAEGYYYIGIAFADAGMYREAVREWENILKVAPGSEAAKNARENIDALKSFMTSQ